MGQGELSPDTMRHVHAMSNEQRNANDEQRTIRAFIAFEISDEARTEISRVEKELKASDTDVKWVAPALMHLTLKFLGNVQQEDIQKLSGCLDGIAAVSAAFDAVLHDLGVFPGWDHPKVVWVGLSEGAHRMTEVASMAEEAMETEGFAKEDRRFSPHITIGRVRTDKNKDKLKKISENIIINPACSRISRIVLFKSELTPKGSVYTPLHAAEFKG